VSTCDYEYHDRGIDFKCLELIHNRKATRCIFHDINYLKGNNYENNSEEVANRFNRKVSKYNSNNMPLEFIGYCLPRIYLTNKQFTEPVYFNNAIFCGDAYFSSTKFSGMAIFDSAAFSYNANFDSATITRALFQLHSPAILTSLQLCSLDRM